jgi:hypothetical protein
MPLVVEMERVNFEKNESPPKLLVQSATNRPAYFYAIKGLPI